MRRHHRISTLFVLLPHISSTLLLVFVLGVWWPQTFCAFMMCDFKTSQSLELRHLKNVVTAVDLNTMEALMTRLVGTWNNVANTPCPLLLGIVTAAAEAGCSDIVASDKWDCIYQKKKYYGVMWGSARANFLRGIDLDHQIDYWGSPRGWIERILLTCQQLSACF